MTPTETIAQHPALAAIAMQDLQAQLQRQWRPIVTAPKDGTPVLAWSREFGARETKSETYGEGSVGFAQGRKDRWWSWSEPVSNWAHKWQPTHWMPLPPPPRCEYCDGTGHVSAITGEWRGTCSCPAGKNPAAL